MTMTKRIAFAVILIVVFSCAALAADRGPSTQEERARFVTITKQLIENPLDDSNKSDVRWAFQWLTEVPDITVSICSNPVEALLKEKAKNDPGLLMIHTFGMAVYLIEHPDQKGREAAIQMAGMEAILKAYANAQKLNPKLKMKSIDSYARMQAEGTLADFVKKATTECK